MSNSSRYIIILGGVAAILLLIFSTHKIGNKSTLDWSNSFNFDSKDAYGYYIFTELLQKKYPNVLYHPENDFYRDSTGDKTLHIFVGSELEFSDGQEEEVGLFSDDDEFLVITQYKPKNTLNLVEEILHYNRMYEDQLSVISLDYQDNQSVFNYRHYNETFDQATKHFFNQIKLLDSTNYAYDVISQSETDSSIICINFPYYRFTLHSNPYLFTNVATKSDGYLQYFNSLFSHFDVDKVVVYDADKFKTSNSKNDSPIQFIMANRSLRWAYLLLLGSFMTYLIAGSKRKMRAIPTVEEKKNTSVEFVRTLSRLYQNQDQNHKLVAKMQTIFLHKVSKKYFLDTRDPDFIVNLAKKSQYDQTKIEHILSQFEKADKGHTFNDSQLTQLHKELDNFYQKSK